MPTIEFCPATTVRYGLVVRCCLSAVDGQHPAHPQHAGLCKRTRRIWEWTDDEKEYGPGERK